MFILCPSTLLWPCALVVNHVCPRLADGRLGSALPALWVCLRQMGLCIHLLAPCLPTVRSAQVSRGAHAAFQDLSSPQGLCFQLLVFSPPRDVDCGRATTVSPRLAVWHKIKLEKHFLLFFYFLFFCNCRFLIAHWQFRGQYPRSVHTGILHSSLSRDCPGAAPGFSIVIIDFNLETKVTDLLELVWSMTCMLGSEVIFGELLR